jgi:RNA polymerase sigma factor (sigma-70 family)
MQDVALVDLMLRDPDAGLAAVYEHYADRIHDYCRSILRDDADAADALQDTFLAASARIAQLRDPERLRPWLYAIARNRSHRTIRDRGRQRPLDDLDGVVTAAEPTDAARLESDEARALVWEAAGGLDEGDRDVLDLHLRHGLDGAELAAVMGVTPPQANQAMHRMRERLNRSVGAALAMRYGRRSCDELRSIVGQESLSPLLRKRVARHIERCDTCDTYRHAGARIFAAIPFVPAPDVLGRALVAAGAGGQAGEQAAAGIDWGESGFPRPSAPGPSSILGAGPSRDPAPSGGLARLAPAPGPARSRMPRVVGAVAAGAVVAVAGFLIGRLVAEDGSTDVVASQPLPSTVEQADAAPTTGGPTTSTLDSAQSGSTSVASTTTTTGDTTSPTTAASSTTATTVDPVPTVTFSSDRRAPTLAVAVDCGSGIRITATITDDVDPAPTGDLEVAWPPGRIRAMPASPAAPIYEVLLQGGDITGLDGQVTFLVSGRISDAAGNPADVVDSVTCIFVED